MEDFHMKRYRKNIALFLAIVLVLGLPMTSHASKIHLNRTKVKMTVGSTVKLKIKGCKGKKVKWKSSKKSVATVSKKGKVKAKKKGTAVITAKVRGKKYRCKVTVTARVVRDMSKYLAATENCQVGNNRIKEQVNKLTSGLPNDHAKASAIFKFVNESIGTVSYDDDQLLNSYIDYDPYDYDADIIYGNVTKYGAVGTLSAKKGNDSDQAHLLIALLRTAGIPARYAYGGCVFHGQSQRIAEAKAKDEGDDSEVRVDHVWVQVTLDGGKRWIDLDSTRETRIKGYSTSQNILEYAVNGFGVIATWDTTIGPSNLRYYASLPF